MRSHLHSHHQAGAEIAFWAEPQGLEVPAQSLVQNSILIAHQIRATWAQQGSLSHDDNKQPTPATEFC
jgi:hypothetical protein